MLMIESNLSHFLTNDFEFESESLARFFESSSQVYRIVFDLESSWITMYSCMLHKKQTTIEKPDFRGIFYWKNLALRSFNQFLTRMNNIRM